MTRGTDPDTASDGFSRRKMLRTIGGLGALAALTPLIAACGGDDDEEAGGEGETREEEGADVNLARYTSDTPGGSVRLLSWELFADDSFTTAFEENAKVDVVPTYFGSFDEMFGKLRSGGGKSYDAVATASDVIVPLAEGGALAPIDVSSLPHYNELRPQLRQAEMWQYQGKQYAIPLDWGSTVFLVNTKKLGEQPGTLPYEMLFDPSLRGRVTSMDDISVLYTTAVYMGHKNYWDLTNEQLTDVQGLLVDKFVPNVRKFAATFADEANLFANNEVDLAWGWTGVIRAELLNVNAAHVTEHIVEPAMPWYVDTLSAVAGSPNLDAVAAWADYNLRPDVAAKRFELMGLPTVVPGAAQHLDDQMQERSYLKEGQKSFWEGLNPDLQWHPVPRRALYQEVWNSVKTGEKKFPG